MEIYMEMKVEMRGLFVIESTAQMHVQKPRRS